MGNAKTDTEIKIYKNSECSECFLAFTPPLNIKLHPATNKEIIICRDCWINLNKINK